MSRIVDFQPHQNIILKCSFLKLENWDFVFSEELEEKINTVLRKTQEKIIVLFHSYCNNTQEHLGINKLESIKKKFPDLFQEHVMCAGSAIVKQGKDGKTFLFD